MMVVVRRRLRCRGVVQGVGFRPAIYRLAVRHGLVGFVRNDGHGVTIEVEGKAESAQAFECELAESLPPLANIMELDVEDVEPRDEPAFTIAATASIRREQALVPPDVALCDHCREEILDPGDRRFEHPFVSCTDCGPRYSIVQRLPYDRAWTSMAAFPMCDSCAREYEDPTNRRFHAEPICCPDCGPRVCYEATLHRQRSKAVAQRLYGRVALQSVRDAITMGSIVAVKGIGGYQLACRADRSEVVDRLRSRKHREGKPLAVMVRDLRVASRLVELRTEDRELLASPEGPIVLAPRLATHEIADSVVEGLDDLGVMLPTTPLHVELFEGAEYDALVMTSGNRSHEPICIDDEDARERLSSIADAILSHDRAIVRRVDDSVVRTMPAVDAPCFLRRSRGYAPASIRLPGRSSEPILALGGHLQTTVCITCGEFAFPSQHVGDLDTCEARTFMREVVHGLESFLDVEPQVIVADLHPDYPSGQLATELADARGGRVVRVQHHLAHAAAVLAEHDALPSSPSADALAIVLDGTGFGIDATAWGCEWITIDSDLRACRVAHGQGLPLIGGEHAVREPWRIAAATLVDAGHGDWLDALPIGASIDRARLHTLMAVAEGGAFPRVHGAGRMFEAVGALLGLCVHNRYEGEAALSLEATAARATEVLRLPVSLEGGVAELPQAELIVAAARCIRDGIPVATVARGLFATFSELAAELTMRVLPAGCIRVALAGGCFANRLLVADLEAQLRRRGLTVLRARRLPPGDGGLAYGQAALAAFARSRPSDSWLVVEPHRRDSCVSPCR